MSSATPEEGFVFGARDPARIDATLKLVGEFWRANPDMRLCQILHNALSQVLPMTTGDIFYIEDVYVAMGLHALSLKLAAQRAALAGPDVIELRVGGDAVGREGKEGA